MSEITLYKQNGSTNGEVTLNDDIFGIEPNESLVFEAVRLQRNSQRQGTHAVKNRSARRGGGKKPWRQKGTGRARAGSNTSPIWVGGGVVFGPTPRKYGFNMPRKQARLALKSALSDRAHNNNVIVVDELAFDAPKTKDFIGFLENIDVEEKALVLVEGDSEFVALSARNIPGVKVLDVSGINVLDIIAHNKLIFTQEALNKLEEALS